MPLIRKPVLGLVEEVLLALYGTNHRQLERLLKKYGFGVAWDCNEHDPEFEYVSSLELDNCDWTDRGMVQSLLDALSEAIMVHQTQPGYAEADEDRVSHLLDVLDGAGFQWNGSGFDWSRSQNFASTMNGLIRLQRQKFEQETPTLKANVTCAANGGGSMASSTGGPGSGGSGQGDPDGQAALRREQKKAALLLFLYNNSGSQVYSQEASWVLSLDHKEFEDLCSELYADDLIYMDKQNTSEKGFRTWLTSEGVLEIEGSGRIAVEVVEGRERASS
jgi:hypothetical protein